MKTSRLAAKLAFQTRRYHRPYIYDVDNFKPLNPPAPYIQNGLGTPTEDENFNIFKSLEEETEENKRKEDALKTMAHLRYLQLGLCLVLLGGYARIGATTLNSFAPDKLDDAFDDHWEIAAPLIVLVAVCVVADFLYYWALTARDSFDFNEKQKEYKAAKDAKQESKEKEGRLRRKESEAILNRIADANREILKKRKKRIQEVIEKDLFIQQLLIQSDIRQQDLMDEYRADENADIIELLKKNSINVSLKDYKYNHKEYQDRSRNIEYLQALKLPLRFISILLLMEGRAFTCPNIIEPTLEAIFGHDTYTFFFGEDEFLPGYYQFMILGGLILWAINAYAYKLEFQKNDNNVEYDKDIRKLKNAHHNAVLATLVLALERKTRETNPTMIKADENQNQNLFWGHKFTDVIYLKLAHSFFFLGPLARRPLTIFALTGAELTQETQAIVGAAVFVLWLADLYYVNLSLTKEKWDLKNQENKKFVLHACKKQEDMLQNIQNVLPDDATSDERILFNELNMGDKTEKPYEFDTAHPWLAGYNHFIDEALWFKFGLRAVSLAFSLPKFFGKDESLKSQHLGNLAGNEALMLFAGIFGMLLGYMLQRINAERSRRLRPSEKDPENFLVYTNRTVLFFREPNRDLPPKIHVEPNHLCKLQEQYSPSPHLTKQPARC